MKLPSDISAGAASRRRLLADLLIAVAIAIAATLLAAGVGVVAFLALPTFLFLLAWIAIEAAIRGLRRRAPARGAEKVAGR